jgi:sugar phosphate isomerase/epimerase
MMILMRTLGRRQFLERSAGLLPLATLRAKAAGTQHLKNIGVQLYTVRKIIAADPAAVLKSIQDDGYTEVECIFASLPTIWNALSATKLKPVSVHIDSDTFKDTAKIDEALGKAHQWGFQYAVYPYLPVPERGGEDAIKSLANKLNKAGEQSKKLGIQLCYHNHAFEFQPMNGTTPLQILLNETEKNLVALEVDVFWASVAGHDPVHLIQHHSGRIALVHLKDKAKNQPVQYNEDVPADAFKEIGRGSLDFSAILRAATNAGVKHFFVEQDQTPGSPLDSLKISYDYLHNLSF